MTGNRILHTLQTADIDVFLHIVQWNTRQGIRPVARLVSHSGDGWFYPLVPLVIYQIAPSLGITVATALVYGLVLERMCYLALKSGFKRNRPPNAIAGFESVITASDEFSFPSGHTSAAFLLVTTLVLLTSSSLLILCYGWCAMIALSRVVLGVHFPLDTVAGALLGSAIAWITVQLI